MEVPPTSVQLGLNTLPTPASVAETIRPGLQPDIDILSDTGLSIEEELEEYMEWHSTLIDNLQCYTEPSIKDFLEQSIDAAHDIITIQKQIAEDKSRIAINNMLPKLTFILETLSRQYKMLKEILNSDDNPEATQEINEKYEDLKNFAITVENKSKICMNMAGFGINFILRNLLGPLLHVTQKLSIIEKSSLAEERLETAEIQILMNKIAAVSEFLQTAVVYDSADMFALGHDHPYWDAVKEVVRIREIAPPEQLRRSFSKFVKNIYVAMSMISSGENKSNEFIKNLSMGFGAVYYFFLSEEAQRQTNLFYSSPQGSTAFQAWNMLDQKLIAQMMVVTLPFIWYSKRVYINRVYNSVTFDSVKKALDEGTLNTLAPLPLGDPETSPGKSLLSLMNENRITKVLVKGNSSKLSILILSPKWLSMTQPDLISSSRQLDSMNNSFVSPLINSNNNKSGLLSTIGNSSVGAQDSEKIVYYKEAWRYGILNQMQYTVCLEEIKSSQESPTLPKGAFDGIIIHIHGGGFVSMSSGSHQNYTRQWAKMVKRPLFSIDYRLAPESTYPAGLDDCWQAYNWIINEAPQIFGIDLKKVVITGDSAGGNLAIGVTLLAIKNGVRIPDGLVLAYPAMNLNVKSFSPSFILAIDDQMVPYSILKLCMNAYVPKEADPSKDPLLSPVYTSDELLSKFPTTKIIVGDRDPLHDDSWRFVDKLRKLKKDVLLVVYREMTHGFLGFDIPLGFSEAHICVKEAADFIKEIFEA